MERMTEINMLNRIAGGNGCDVYESGTHTFERPIANLIALDDDTVIDDAKIMVRAIPTSLVKNYLTMALPAQTLITFATPVVELTISAGKVMAYNI